MTLIFGENVVFRLNIAMIMGMEIWLSFLRKIELYDHLLFHGFARSFPEGIFWSGDALRKLRIIEVLVNCNLFSSQYIPEFCRSRYRVHNRGLQELWKGFYATGCKQAGYSWSGIICMLYFQGYRKCHAIGWYMKIHHIKQ